MVLKRTAQVSSTHVSKRTAQVSSTHVSRQDTCNTEFKTKKMLCAETVKNECSAG